ncbi:MAG: MFS transporter [Puniceicoccales bacterium]
MDFSEQTEALPTMRRATLRELILFASGGIGTGLIYVFLLRFAGSFFETFLNISPGQVAILVLVPRLIDAFTDPIMGAWCDRHVTRFGRFRPYIQHGVYLMGASLVFLFIDWGATPTLGLVLAYVFYIFNQVISTVVKVPYLSSLALLTEDPKQRTLAVSLKFSLSNLLIIPVMAVIGEVIQRNAENGSNLNIYLYVAMVLAVVLVLAMNLVGRSLKRADTKEYWDKQPRQEGAVSPWTGFKDMGLTLWRNKPLLLLAIATGTDFLAFGALSNALVYYFRFNVGDASLLGPYSLLTGIVWIVSCLCVTPVANRFGRKNTYLVITILNIFVSCTLMWIPYTNITLIFVQAGLTAFLQGFSAVLLWTILADCIDYDLWKNRERSEGVSTAAIEFINKFGSSFGAAIFYAIVLPAGYIAVSAEIPNPLQPESAKTAITSVLSVLPAAAYVCSLVAFLFFPIDRNLVLTIRKDLGRN